MVERLQPVNFFSNFAVSVALLIIYVYFFGQHSISRYMAREVIIIEQEETDDSIRQPGKVYFKNIFVFQNQE